MSDLEVAPEPNKKIIMSDHPEDIPETINETTETKTKQSWISHIIKPCTNGGLSSASSCPFGQKGVHQHAFTMRIVQKSDDPRTLLPIAKGVLFSNFESIPFDPAIDPHYEACFNCWKRERHTYKRCREPKIYSFCHNCGRRGVEITECPRCAKGNEEYKRHRASEFGDKRFRRDKSRGRSRVRNTGTTESTGLRDKCRGRNVEFSDLSKGPMNDTRVDQQDSNRGQTKNNVAYDSRNSRDKSRRNARSKSRYREKNVTWSDSQESRDTEQNNYNASARGFNNKDEQLSSAEESVNNITRQYLDLMDSIKHLPAETQNQMVKLFMKEREALINYGARKLE